MKSVSELTDFYYNNLYEDIQQLEDERKKLASRLTAIFIAIAVVTIGLEFLNGELNELAGFIAFGGFAIGGFIYSFSIKGYASNFKRKVIEPLIHAIEPTLAYHPDAYVSQTEFERSRLFNDTIDRYSGNDLVSGSIDNTAIKFSDIHAQKVSRDSKGREHRSTIFKGLFMVAEFNKKLKGRTIVLPDSAEKLFGSLIGSWLQNNNFTRNDLIKMDSSEFEKAFVVYGTDQIEARYILTHSMMHHPDAYVSQMEFERSRLFNDTIDRYSGNDLVSGSIDNTAIKFSDIHAQKVSRDSKGREHRSTIFKGLFMVAEFNKKLKGRTIVLPDSAEKLFGSLIGSWLQNNNFTRNDLIKMDSSEFEKAFVVYGTDQIEARYILTHSMMHRILEYKKRVKKDISLAFVGEKLYVAVHYNEDLFEPTVFTSLLKMEVMLNYIKGLQLAISIIEELKLNEKLWSKI